MTDLYKRLFLNLIFITVIPCGILAQFRGGIASGSIVSSAGNQPLGRNIFLGGNDDGVDVSVASNQPLGRNIFLGGNDDGVDVAIASNQPLGRNIFLGGDDDGVDVAIASNKLLGRNIFLGGNDDGVDVAIASNQPLGRNVFLGGSDDGWAMGFVSNTPLPITLADFSGRWQLNNALLLWKTSTEINTSHFELERSFDGVNYKNIQRINAAGQSSVEKSYQYADVNIKKLLPAGLTNIYYRLRSVDKDGQGNYSGVVILKASEGSEIQYAVYPNPAKDIIAISSGLAVPATDTYIRLADGNGKVLILQKMISNKQQLTVSNFAAGIYYLQLVSANKTVYTQKIIIHK